jgi:transposase
MRQQETTPPPPAVAEFRASQNLLNPNVRVAQFVDSRFKRFQLIKMLNNGVKITHAARSLQISVTGARHIRDRVIELNLLRNRRTPKRVLADYQTNHLIVTTLREQRKIKTKQLLHVLHDQGIPISLRQLRYRISMLGFRYRKMKRVQVISKHNQLKRLLAREFWRKEGYPFSRYLFVDESTVVLGREQEWCWVQKGEQIPCQGRVRHGEGFHVFGGISWFGATDVLVWRSKARMNSAFYCAHNIKDVVAEAKNIFPGGAFELVQVRLTL